MIAPFGFDNEKYLEEQTQAIIERVEMFGDRLYLEFGGKLVFDYHAARVLPGYDPNVKVKLLKRLADKVEIIFCVSAQDVAVGRIRGDFGITYDLATLKTLDDLQENGLPVSAVSINRFSGQLAALALKNKIESRGQRVFLQMDIEGYPNDVDQIVSKKGYGKNPYIPTSKPIVVLAGAGPGSGKMATALSLMYHDHQNGKAAGFAKFETFPIWNIPLEHPINVAYEAATADINDLNLIDPFHLAAHGQTAINYNRDIENFPILRSIIGHILGAGKKTPHYESPTEMGVNCAKSGIIDDKVVCEAAKQEIIRRFLRYKWEYSTGQERKQTVDRVLSLMEQLEIKVEMRKPVLPARLAAEDAKNTGKGNRGLFCGAAIELDTKEIVTGKNSPLLHSASAAILNAVKRFAQIPENIDLLPSVIIENVTKLKREVMGMTAASLDASEILIVLSISSAGNPVAEAGTKALGRLKGCEIHLTHAPTQGDLVGLRRLGMNLTTDAHPTSSGYFHL
jgi:uncharacterized protein (UPF0371 family)